MNAATIQSLQPQNPSGHDMEAFALRADGVNQLIDTKRVLVVKSARLRAVANSHPALRERSNALIQTLEERIERLQQQIDRELKVLLYSLQKGAAPFGFLDDLPG